MCNLVTKKKLPNIINKPHIINYTVLYLNCSTLDSFVILRALNLLIIIKKHILILRYKMYFNLSVVKKIIIWNIVLQNYST